MQAMSAGEDLSNISESSNAEKVNYNFKNKRDFSKPVQFRDTFDLRRQQSELAKLAKK